MATRSEQTKQRLQQALFSLLDDKLYESISMEEIAQCAGCTRVTVHRHYRTKERLLLDCAELLIEQVKDKLIFPNERVKQSTSEISYKNMVALYTHVAEHRGFYQVLFATGAGGKVRSQIRRVIAGVVLNTWMQDGTQRAFYSDRISPASPQMIANTVAELVVGAIVWWLESGSNEDVTVLAMVTLRLTETGIFGFLGRVPVVGDVSFRELTPYSPDRPIA